MQLITINTGFFKLDGGAMFGVVPKTIWKDLNPPDPNNLCTWAMRCLLIIHENNKILIDCGIGNKQSEKFFKHYDLHGTDSLINSLKIAGLSPNDITDVILTHLHFDHCGGAVTKNQDGNLVPTFKNATYWSNEEHWKWASKPNAREKASFLPENFEPLLAHQKIKFATNNQQIANLITLKFVYGHTEAMMIPHIKLNNTTLVYLADLIPSAAHVRLPYVMAYDTRPLLTLQEKENFLNTAIENNFTLYFEHDPINECATLKKNEKGIIEINKTLLLTELIAQQ